MRIKFLLHNPLTWYRCITRALSYIIYHSLIMNIQKCAYMQRIIDIIRQYCYFCNKIQVFMLALPKHKGHSVGPNIHNIQFYSARHFRYSEISFLHFDINYTSPFSVKLMHKYSLLLMNPCSTVIHLKCFEVIVQDMYERSLLFVITYSFY